MPEMIRIASKDELPGMGEAKEFSAGDKVVCVANLNGEFSAMDNVCLHRGGPLGQGVVEGEKVICPWHGWAYDGRSGAVEHNPNVRIAVYPLKVEGDDVLVEL